LPRGDSIPELTEELADRGRLLSVFVVFLSKRPTSLETLDDNSVAGESILCEVLVLALEIGVEKPRLLFPPLLSGDSWLLSEINSLLDGDRTPLLTEFMLTLLLVGEASTLRVGPEPMIGAPDGA
jgi:hypothetical protein